MSNLKSFVLLAATTVASVGAAGMSFAAEAPVMAFHYRPADLKSEEGVQRVYLQIRVAAENACPGVTTGTLLPSEQTLKCREAAIASTVEAIHNKRLAEVASASKKV